MNIYSNHLDAKPRNQFAHASMRSRTFIGLATIGVVITLCLVGCKGGSSEEEPVATEVSVQVAKVKLTTLHAYVEAYGVVEPEPAGSGKAAGAAKLAAPVAGVVMTVPVKEGDKVAAGTVIVKLDDRMALAAVDKAKHAVELASQVMQRQISLKAIDGTSDKVFQEATSQLAAAHAELDTAQAQLAQVHLTTPLSGTVAHINVSPGQAVDLNTVVAEVVDATRLVVTANVAAAEAITLKAGQAVEIYSASNERAMTNSKVLFVSPSADAKTGAVVVRIAVPTNTALRSGEFVRTRIVSEEHAGRLVVPSDSVVTDTEGHSVIAIVVGDNSQQRSVHTGLHDGNWVEVEADGLKEGDTVVTVGAYNLPKQTKVKVLDSVSGHE